MKESTPGVRYRRQELGVLCLGVHGTWRAGGVNVGTGAVGSVSGTKEPVVSGVADEISGVTDLPRTFSILSFESD